MEKQKWPAPEGTALSPFFVTATPISPVDGTITSPYGYRIHPITGELDFHTGLDIAAPNNTPIRAILPGTVKEIGESEIYGNYIVVAHQNGFESVYNHCESITAQDVYKRQVENFWNMTAELSKETAESSDYMRRNNLYSFEKQENKTDTDMTTIIGGQYLSLIHISTDTIAERRYPTIPPQTPTP